MMSINKFIVPILCGLLCCCCGDDTTHVHKKTKQPFARSPTERDVTPPYFKKSSTSKSWPKQPQPQPQPQPQLQPQQPKQQQQQQQLYWCRCDRKVTVCTKEQILSGCYIIYGENSP